MDAKSVIRGLRAISLSMDENREMLIELDSKNGDGDLGISMSDGYRSAYHAAMEEETEDIGQLFKIAAFAFNEAAPSSLGTITTIAFMGMAKYFAGKAQATIQQLGESIEAGLDAVMNKTGSKAGEKTILDALLPAVKILKLGLEESAAEILAMAAAAAAEGSEKTRKMLPVHGRAAYYGEKGLGVIDGGSVAGKLIIQAIAQEFK